MATISIQLPTLLQQLLPKNGLKIDADSLSDAFQLIRAEHSELSVHLFDEAGELRPHVLCFLNGVNSRWMDDFAVKLHDGDQLLIMQAVSGG